MDQRPFVVLFHIDAGGFCADGFRFSVLVLGHADNQPAMFRLNADVRRALPTFARKAELRRGRQGLKISNVRWTLQRCLCSYEREEQDPALGFVRGRAVAGFFVGAICSAWDRENAFRSRNHRD